MCVYIFAHTHTHTHTHQYNTLPVHFVPLFPQPTMFFEKIFLKVF